MASRIIVLLGVYMISAGTHHSQADDTADLASFISGLWHNYRQVDDEITSGVPPEDRHSQMHATFFPVQVPLFGEAETLYLEEYFDGNPDSVYRQRLYVFDKLDPDSSQIRNRLYSFTDPESALNGWQNPEIFENLTEEDLLYNEGCDMGWHRVSVDVFQNGGPTEECTTVINDRLTWIFVSNNLTTEILTIFYQFIDVETGAVIIGWDTPFIMDNVGDSPRIPPITKPNINIAPTRVGKRSIDNPAGQNLTTVLEAVVSGYELHYDVNLAECRTLDDVPRESELEIVGGSVGDFEYFYGERFGPIPYIGASNSDIVLTEEGHRLRLTQVRIYGNDTVRVRIIQGRLNESAEEQYDVLYCDLWDGESGDSKFFIHRIPEKLQLNNFEEVLEALRGGHKLRFVSHYYSCEPNPQETIGGGHLEVFDVSYEEDIIYFHTGSMIYNYFDEEGFLYNGASGRIYRDSNTVELQPAGLVFNTWETKYISLYQCNINDGTFEGGFYFYRLT